MSLCVALNTIAGLYFLLKIPYHKLSCCSKYHYRWFSSCSNYPWHGFIYASKVWILSVNIVTCEHFTDQTLKTIKCTLARGLRVKSFRINPSSSNFPCVTQTKRIWPLEMKLSEFFRTHTLKLFPWTFFTLYLGLFCEIL